MGLSLRFLATQTTLWLCGMNFSFQNTHYSLGWCHPVVFKGWFCHCNPWQRLPELPPETIELMCKARNFLTWVEGAAQNWSWPSPVWAAAWKLKDKGKKRAEQKSLCVWSGNCSVESMGLLPGNVSCFPVQPPNQKGDLHHRFHSLFYISIKIILYGTIIILKIKIKFLYHPTLMCIKPPALLWTPLEIHEEQGLEFSPFIFCNITQNFSLLKTKSPTIWIAEQTCWVKLFECLCLKLLPPTH